jgi:hypothetical protein
MRAATAARAGRREVVRAGMSFIAERSTTTATVAWVEQYE